MVQIFPSLHALPASDICYVSSIAKPLKYFLVFFVVPVCSMSYLEVYGLILKYLDIFQISFCETFFFSFLRQS
jgi:hypothetical protein